MQKRIVLFSPGHGEPGGAAARSRLLASTLAQRGWQVCAVTRAGSLYGFRFHRSSNLRVLEVPGFGRQRLGAALFLLIALPTGVVWGRHASAFIAIRLASPATAAALCGLIARRPYLALTTYSGGLSDVHHVLSTPSARFRQWLLRRASFLVAQTAFGAAELETLTSRERIAVLPNPVGTVQSPPLNGRPHGVYSGRLSEEKDLVRLLVAWRIVLRGLPDAKLKLVGAGGSHRSVERELRQTVKSDPLLRTSVEFTGWVSDVGKHLESADVYVFPSLEEGMSNALLEACVYTRVIVASDIPQNRAVLGDDYPLLFRAGDTADLAAALKRAFASDVLRARAQSHVSRRIRKFSPEIVLEQLEQLIKASDRTNRHDFSGRRDLGR